MTLGRNRYCLRWSVREPRERRRSELAPQHSGAEQQRTGRAAADIGRVDREHRTACGTRNELDRLVGLKRPAVGVDLKTDQDRDGVLAQFGDLLKDCVHREAAEILDRQTLPFDQCQVRFVPVSFSPRGTANDCNPSRPRHNGGDESEELRKVIFEDDARDLGVFGGEAGRQRTEPAVDDRHASPRPRVAAQEQIQRL